MSISQSGVAASGLANDVNLMLLQLCFDTSELDEPADTSADIHADVIKKAPTTAVDNTAAPAAADSFDPFAFVAGRAQHVPLDVLERDLRTYSAYLQSALLTCVHDEVYDAFTTVAGRLGGSTLELVEAAQAPLRSALAGIDAAATKVESRQAAAASHLEAAAAAEVERRHYAALIEAHLLQRSLLADVAAHEEASKAAATKEAAVFSRLETLVQGASRVSVLVDELRACAAVATATQEMRLEAESFSKTHAPQVRAAVLAALGAAFKSAYADTTAASAPISHIVGAVVGGRTAGRAASVADADAVEEATRRLRRVCELFTAMDEVPALVLCFRDSIVRPVCEEVVSWKAVSNARSRQLPTPTAPAGGVADAGGGHGADATGLLTSLADALAAGPLACVPLLRDAIRPATGDRSVDAGTSFVLAAWAAASETIGKRLPYVFSCGIAQTFHRNFSSANLVLAALEAACSDADELCLLRTSDETTLWARRWNLDVYAALRQAESLAWVSQTIATATIDETTGAFSACAAALERLGWIFDARNGAFLFALQHFALRDAAAVVAAVSNRAVALVAETAAAPSGGPSGAPAAATMRRWTAARTTLLVFAEALRQKVPVLVDAACAGAWCGGGTNAVNAADFGAALADSVRVAVERTDTIVTGGVIARCAAGLANVKLVKATFSMTKKPVPSVPSVFLRPALEPLAEFVATLRAHPGVHSDLVQVLVERVVTEIAAGLGATMREIAMSARKAQEGLEKLRRARREPSEAAASATATSGGAAGPTDRDKMMAQLYLDVQEIANVVRAYGIEHESFAPLAELFSLVQRGQWVLGGCVGPEPAEIPE